MTSLSVLQQPEVLSFVRMARVARLATASAEAIPHAVPLCFCFDSSNFYFVVDEKPKRQRGLKLKRMRNIGANPQVALLIDQYEEDWNQLAYVLITGRAQIVEDQEEYMEALRHLRDKYLQYRAMPLSRESNPMVRIEPVAVHAWGARFTPPAAGAPRQDH